MRIPQALYVETWLMKVSQLQKFVNNNICVISPKIYSNLYRCIYKAYELKHYIA